MPTDTYRKMEKQSIKHAKNPQPGDYWHEMFTPILLVLKVTRKQVIFLEKVKAVGKDRWTWDVEKVSVLPRKEFKKKLYYSTMPKTWCDVVPNWRDADAFIEAAL